MLFRSQDYIAKSKATAAYQEIASGKTAYELNASQGLTLTAASDIGLASATATCSAITVTAPDSTGAATGAIKCTVATPARLGTGASIQFDRTTTGLYTCVTANFASASYKPSGCS